MNRSVLFQSEGKHNIHETVTNTIPLIIGNDRAILNQTGNYNIENTITSQIHPASNLLTMNQNNLNPFQQASLNHSPGRYQAVQSNYPGGVTITFQDRNSPTSTNWWQNPISNLTPQTQQPSANFDELRLQYERVQRQLEQQILSNLYNQAQERVRQRQLQFHYNQNTSTDDLRKSLEMTTQTGNENQSSIPTYSEEATQCELESREISIQCYNDDDDIFKNNHNISVCPNENCNMCMNRRKCNETDDDSTNHNQKCADDLTNNELQKYLN